MNAIFYWLLYLLTLLIMPFLTMGLIAKLKALFQNRIGPPLFQPFYSFVKLMKKGEVVSKESSWFFNLAPLITLSCTILLGFYIPWLSFKPPVPDSDLFLVIYLAALIRFFSILSSIDCGSPLSGFGGSREATLSILVEPSIVLSLISLALIKGNTDLNIIFGTSSSSSFENTAIWALAAGALFLASIVELSRMPADDPTTHLELTMIHESMILENSGRNLAFMELAYAIKLVVIYGLVVQCLIHSFESIMPISEGLKMTFSLLGISSLAFVTALLESFFVKLKWRKVPGFIAYAVTLSLLGCFASILTGFGS